MTAFQFPSKRNSRKITTILSVSLAAIVMGTAIVPHANAGSRERLIIGGVAAGIIGTAIVANEIRKNRESDDYHSSRWERHVDRCYRAYRSYDEETDTYIDYNGNERRCRK